VDRLLLAMLVLLCTQGFAPVPNAAAQSLSDQVSDLLRQQLEARKTAPPEVPSTSPPEIVGPPLPEIVGPPLPEIVGPPLPSTEETPSRNTTSTSPTAPAAAPTEAQSVKTAKPSPKLTAGKELIRAAAMLSRFYEGRGYRPAWSNDAGPLPYADALINTIQTEAEREGLHPGDYRLVKLNTLLQEVRQQPNDAPQPLDPRTLADLDLLLTDTFLTYGARVSVGNAKLDRMDAAWFEKHQKADLVQVLQTAVETDRVVDAIKALPPPYPGYTKLREALAQYRNIAAHGGWPLVPEGPKFHPGDHDNRVVTLRARLQVTGELTLKSQKDGKLSRASPGDKGFQKNSPSERELFDKAVEQAVRKFQRRHGLSADGVVGDTTLAALDVSAEDRVQQLAVNMERWRTLPGDLGPRHIDVNIPNFTLAVVENDQPVMNMKVVVGKMMERRNTPTFSANMTHLVLNPYWYVPKSIAEEELFPLSRKDSQYFAKHGFVIRRIPVGEKHIPDPNATDGSLISTKTYQNVLRQQPGPTNALGRVKFIFPNAHGVYLHDTPSKELFNRAVRTFSHGCIRIEKPLDLAEYVLRGTSEWTHDAILATIERQKEKTVWLPEPIPVYIQYWTAWVDGGGTVQFRNDIYGYDQLPGTRLPIAKPAPPQSSVKSERQPIVQPETPSATRLEPQPAPSPKAQPTL
jgi:murein L,D-transpeptidase YcbB/YkuD